jgi:hypothetical protein
MSHERSTSRLSAENLHRVRTVDESPLIGERILSELRTVPIHNVRGAL